MRARFLVVLLACAKPSTRPPDSPDAIAHAEVERHFAIWLGGARVGTASEVETWATDGVTLRRHEEMHFLRETTPVSIVTDIEVQANAALEPQRVRWRQSLAARGNPKGARAEALNGPGGWSVLDGEAALAPPRHAVPAELVPLLVKRDGKFTGTVFFPARGFVAGTGEVIAVAPDRFVGRLAFDNGTIAEATIDVGADRTYTRVVDGEGVIAIRTTATAARAPFDPVDIVAATAIPIDDARRGRSGRLVIDGPAPPPLPGQLARLTDDGVELVLSASLAGGLPDAARTSDPRSALDRSREIAALVASVRQTIEPDLGAGPTSSASARTATKGDCTTYALAYAAHAARLAIPTRVVTGYRVDGDRLVRHRWAISWTGRAWIAIDAAFGAAPAGGDLVGLAVHDADDAGLVAGEAALAQVRSARWR